MTNVSFVASYSHKVYMKIQEVMMKKLDCATWESVREQYPMTSSYKALQEHFIVFRDWVSVSFSHYNLYLFINMD